MKIGLMVPAAGTVPAPLTLVEQIEQAERLGLQSVWMPNVFGSDALTVLALAGSRTSNIELGTLVMPTYTRHPAVMAQQALTTNALAQGRLTLGIGVSHRVRMEQMLGLDWDHPIRHLREYLACLAPLLRGEAAFFQGQEYTLDGYTLTIPGATPPPILVAALGPQMLRLTGRLADGTAIFLAGPNYLREHAIPTITAAAQDAGRPAPRILTGLPICVTARGAEARDHANRTYAHFAAMPSYRAILDKEGATDPADVALIGTAAEVSAGLHTLRDIGVTDYVATVFALPGDDPTPTYDLLREHALKG